MMNARHGHVHRQREVHAAGPGRQGGRHEHAREAHAGLGRQVELPGDQQQRAGQAMIPTTATFCRMLMRFSLLRKNGEAIEK